MKKIGLLAAVLAATVAVGCNRDQTTGNATTSGTPGAAGTSGSAASPSDVNFVRDVSELNGTTIDLSRLAADRSTNPDVKAFAQQAIADHTAAGDKLTRIATDSSIANEPSNDKPRKESNTLAGKQGPDFDRAYIDAMIDGHDKLLSKLDSRVDKKGHDEAKTVEPGKADNPITRQINQWAADTYATAAAHLDRAKALKDAMKK